MNINSSWTHSFSSGLLHHKFVEFWNVLYGGKLRKESKYSHGSFIYEIIKTYKDRKIYLNKNLYLCSFNDDA
jgi:hypothetical protein